jgi:hypothetical protein
MPKSPIRKSQQSKSKLKKAKSVSPKRASPKRASPKKVSPKKVVSKRASPKKGSPKRASPKKVIKQSPKPEAVPVVPAPVVEEKPESSYSMWYALIGLLLIVGLALLGYFLFLRLRPKSGLFTKSGQLLSSLKKEEEFKDEKVKAHKLNEDDVLVYKQSKDVLLNVSTKHSEPEQDVSVNMDKPNKEHEWKVSDLKLNSSTPSLVTIKEFSSKEDLDQDKASATFMYKLQLNEKPKA